MIDIKEAVSDVSDHFNCLKAEQRGKDVLILRSLGKPLRRFDGKMASYELEYRWLSAPADLTCVLGNEFTYWQAEEIEGWEAESLFGMFRLFP